MEFGFYTFYWTEINIVYGKARRMRNKENKKRQRKKKWVTKVYANS